MQQYDLNFSEYKSKLRGSKNLKSSFEAVRWGMENISPFSYKKAIKFLRLYPKVSSEIIRKYPKNTKELVKYLPPVIKNDDKAVKWYIDVLNNNSETILEFLEQFSHLDSAIEHKNYEIAKKSIKDIRDRFGESLVLQNREVRILRETSDIKTFTQDVDKKIKENGHCVGSIILRMSSRIYSDEFSYRSYEKDCEKFINKVTPIELKSFLFYWLLNRRVDSNETGELLSIAASSSIYDLFFILFDTIDIDKYFSRDNFNSEIENSFTNYFKSFMREINFDESYQSSEEYLDDIAYYGRLSAKESRLDGKSNIRSNLIEHVNRVFVRAFSDKFNPLGKCFEINFFRYNRDSGEVTDNFDHLIKNIAYWLIKSNSSIESMEYIGSLANKNDFHTEKSLHASAVKLLREGNFQESLNAVEDSTRRADIVKDILICEIYKRQDNLGDLIRLCSDLIVENLEYSYILPLNEPFNERWKKLAKVEDKLSLTICLFALYLSNPIRATLRNIRYSWQDSLKQLKVNLPSEIKVTSYGIVDEKVIFFLRYICNVEVMETHRAFEKTRDIEEEMRMIFANLIQYDYNNEEDYQQKILLITTKHKIEDAIKKMDRSRVFVDLGMLVSWAENNISDSLRRFRIVASREYKEVEEFFENTIKSNNTKKNGDDSPILVFVSSHESNIILGNIIEDVLDNYLNNSDYGLDAYLSMRIRHGSFSGQIRSPLQNNNMIAYLSEDSIYFYPNFWADSEDSIIGKIISEKIIDFSKKIDVLIDDFVKNKLRIRSEDKPEGFFDIILEDLDIAEIKGIALEGGTVSAFIIDLFVIFREKIKKCLLVARKYLEDNLKPEVNNLLYELRVSIDSVIDKKYSDSFITSYENTIKETNIAFARVIEWFDFNVEFENNSDLTFREYVDLFIESAHYAHIDFGIKSSINIDFEHTFDTMTISRLNDIVFTLIDNMYKYSGSIEPEVEIHFSMENNEKLKFQFVSYVSNAVDKNLINSRTEDIMRKVYSGEKLPDTKNEGRSGLIKVANTARISGGDMLFAGLDESKSKYVVELTLGVKSESISR